MSSNHESLLRQVSHIKELESTLGVVNVGVVALQQSIDRLKISPHVYSLFHFVILTCAFYVFVRLESNSKSVNRLLLFNNELCSWNEFMWRQNYCVVFNDSYN